MKTCVQMLVLCLSSIVTAQAYFHEDFNYDSFEALSSLYRNGDKSTIWRTQHALRDIDINENGVIDGIEQFKKTTIVEDPFEKGNKIIRFELNKISPRFYAKYACDTRISNNVVEDAQLDKRYNKDKDLYCTDCSEDSPLKKFMYEWDVHMKRNEIATVGSKKNLFKYNRSYWFGYSMLLDDEYELESENNGDIVSQFHVTGKGANSPPIVIVVNKGKFYLSLIKDNGGKPEAFELGSVIKNEWIDWKFHIVLSKKDKKGIIEVWKNGQLLHSIKGRNIDKRYKMYLKLGIYKFGWWTCRYDAVTTKRKVISYDKVWADKRDIKR